AMRSQQEQARAEQQRIKNLVLNYDLRDEDPNDAALDAQSPYNQPRIDKSGTSRNVTRSRKLQLSDVD
ncbi:hypothetical protein KCU73_g11900, partial [Aureobasidium melanogenum]